MARTTTHLDDDGRPVTYKTTRAQRKSTQRAIPWTAGPQTTAQKIARKLWG